MPMTQDEYVSAITNGMLVKQAIEDAGSCLHIWYDGPYAYAKITVGGSALITGKADDTDGATTAAPWGTAGVITHSAAATDTLGEIADEINKYQSQGWHCRITGGLRATTVNVDGDIIDMSATSCKGDGVHLYLDSSAVDEAYLEISNWDAYNDHRGCVVLLQQISANITATTATGTAPKIYECRGIAHADKETLIYTGADLTSATWQYVDADTDWGGEPLRTAPGNHFVIKWGTEGTSVMTGTAGLVTTRAMYSILGQSPQKKFRSDRQ